MKKLTIKKIDELRDLLQFKVELYFSSTFSSKKELEKDCCYNCKIPKLTTMGKFEVWTVDYYNKEEVVLITLEHKISLAGAFSMVKKLVKLSRTTSSLRFIDASIEKNTVRCNWRNYN